MRRKFPFGALEQKLVCWVEVCQVLHETTDWTGSITWKSRIIYVYLSGSFLLLWIKIRTVIHVHGYKVKVTAWHYTSWSETQSQKPYLQCMVASNPRIAGLLEFSVGKLHFQILLQLWYYQLSATRLTVEDFALNSKCLHSPFIHLRRKH